MTNQYANDFTDTVKIYYDELKKTKPMSKTREKRLLIQSKHGNIKARNEILESNLKFVFDIAKKYTGRGVSISDLISEGNMGLIYAISKFDESKDVKFISYAVWWIRHSIIDAIKKRKNTTSFEIDAYEFSDTKYDNNTSDSEDEYVSMGETTFSDSADGKLRETYDTQNRTISDIMESLNERETVIINHFFGVNGKEKLNLVEIGKKIGITSERARQIKNSALRKLRSNAMLIDDCDDLFA